MPYMQRRISEDIFYLKETIEKKNIWPVTNIQY